MARKFFRNKDVIFITSRTEQGLPMPPNILITRIIWGILASATEKYEIKVCHFVFMSNHFHMLAVVENPDHVKDFVGYVKTEISHSINRLLGRRKRTIWEDGYDSPRLATVEQILKFICYIYLNPTKADLVHRVTDYPGASTWKMFIEGKNTARYSRIPRSALKQLHSAAIPINQQRDMVARFERMNFEESTLQIDPWAWLVNFPTLDKNDVFQRLIRRIEKQDRELRQKRLLEEKDVVGVTRLRRQSMLKEHTPKQYSPRMIVLCEDIQLRSRIIAEFKAICQKAKEIYRKWKIGDFSLKMPAGLYAPRMPALCSAIRT